MVDLNLLRALPKGAPLPGKFTAVLPDQLVREILGSEQPVQQLAKLNATLGHPQSRDRFLAGLTWHEIVARQQRPDQVRAGVGALIDVELSESLIAASESGDVFDLGAIDTTGLDDTKHAFVSIADRYLEWIRANSPASLKDLDTPEGRERLVRVPFDPSFLEVWSFGPYGSRAWHRVWSHYPDRCAAARWLRIAYWYCLRRSAAPEENRKRFGNSYDDAHYVFASLYTLNLCTQDKGMAQAARAVSGDRVHVYDSLDAIPQ